MCIRDNLKLSMTFKNKDLFIVYSFVSRLGSASTKGLGGLGPIKWVQVYFLYLSSSLDE